MWGIGPEPQWRGVPALHKLQSCSISDTQVICPRIISPKKPANKREEKKATMLYRTAHMWGILPECPSGGGGRPCTSCDAAQSLSLPQQPH